MKKLFLLLLSVLILLASYLLEGGSFITLIPFTLVIPLGLGTLFTTMFSFQFKEIVDTFKSAFSEEINPGHIKDYYQNLLTVKNLQSATIFWASTILILALVQILSTLTTPSKLGPSVAIALSSLFYGFFLRAALFIPMENSLRKKIFLIGDKQTCEDQDNL